MVQVACVEVCVAERLKHLRSDGIRVTVKVGVSSAPAGSLCSWSSRVYVHAPSPDALSAHEPVEEGGLELVRLENDDLALLLAGRKRSQGGKEARGELDIRRELIVGRRLRTRERGY